MRSRSIVLAAVLALPALGAACTNKDSDAIAVTGTDDACTPAATTADAGDVTFAFTNKASKVSELYVLRADGSVASEVENVTPGTTRDLTVSLSAGTYTLNCKPGQAGDGFTAEFTVTGEGGASVPSEGAEVEVIGSEYRFELEGSPTFTAGTAYTFEFTNEGTIDHELEILTADGTSLGEVPPTKAGASGRVTVTFPEAGEYQLVCGIDGHEASGMKRPIDVG